MRTRRARSWKQDEASLALLITWLGIGACAILIYLWADQWHRVSIWQAAEDDCSYYHGAYELREVEPVVSRGAGKHRDGVWCIYRGF